MNTELNYNTGVFYTAERNKQILISLLKQYGINTIIVSPGATNVTFVASLQHDSYFKMFSCVDERSAAYMALGMALQQNTPIVLSCTGATSSRNYFPALTEAHKRNIPILVITSSLSTEYVGHFYPQVTDREHAPIDMISKTFVIQNVKDSDDEWDCTLKINKALNLVLSGLSGPVHLNLETTYNKDFSIRELPVARCIRVITSNQYPEIKYNKIAIFIGSHKSFDSKKQHLIERFCEQYNAVVLCDHTSNYYGKYRLNMSLVYVQEKYISPHLNFDLIIHLGDITGDYYTCNALFSGELWRISPDGELRDRFRNLKYVFKTDEDSFFGNYTNGSNVLPNECKLYNELKVEYQQVLNRIPEMPFSNIWIAKTLSTQIPNGSSIHFGILNSLRAWNFFNLPDNVTSFCNVGGFGIDGCLSSLVGAAISHPEKLYFGVFGDLSFFYDMNVLVNSKIPSNLRILIVNNGRGTEFRNYNHIAAVIGNAVDPYVSAACHFGCQSELTIKNYARDCGFHYLSASSKDTFNKVYPDFTSSELIERPIIFEVFTNSDDESNALYQISNCMPGGRKKLIRKIKHIIRKCV
jgi:2-succinyl-5-enolpyruvyl-6-hydroxy-3-cyclohexene-1-carboxylate synthase